MRLPNRAAPNLTLWPKFIRTGCQIVYGRSNKKAGPACSSTTLNKPLLDCIDKNGNGRTSAASLVAAARAMKLNVGN